MKRSLTVVLSFVLGMSVACQADLPTQEVAIEGDAAVMRTFAGRWYNSDNPLTAEVVPGSPGRLVVRLPDGFRASSSWTAEGEVRLEVEYQGDAMTLALRFAERDILTIVSADRPSVGCANGSYYYRGRFGALRKAIAEAPMNLLAELSYALTDAP